MVKSNSVFLALNAQVVTRTGIVPGPVDAIAAGRIFAVLDDEFDMTVRIGNRRSQRVERHFPGGERLVGEILGEVGIDACFGGSCEIGKYQ